MYGTSRYLSFYSLQLSQVKRTLKVPLMNLSFEEYVSNLCHLQTAPRSDDWTAWLRDAVRKSNPQKWPLLAYESLVAQRLEHLI